MVALTIAKPAATFTVEPTGGRSAAPREHSITLKLELSAQRPRYADKDHVMRVARRALELCAPVDGEPDQRRFGEVSVTRRSRKTAPESMVVAVEGSASWHGRPADELVARLREELVAEGYRVSVRERRECGAEGCKVEAMVEWGRAAELPSGWHSSTVCGAHNYRTCAKCKALYALSSTSSVGPAPSLQCEICGLLLVAWGSSKIWSAVLMSTSRN